MNKSVPPAALPEADRVRLVREGLAVGHELVPLWAATVDYFQLPPDSWRDLLGAVRALGFRLIDVRVPWNVHELEPDVYDFGQQDPKLDVRGFLTEAARFGLYALVRLGPRQEESADLAFAGLPRRVAWDGECQALTPKGHPVVIPRLLWSSPEPSAFSERYLRQCEAWLSAAADCLRSLVFPHGPIALLELGSQHAERLLKRTLGDYHPLSQDAYREYLKQRYERPNALRAAHGSQIRDFPEATPPRGPVGLSDQPLQAHLDWLRFQRRQLTQALRRFEHRLERSGFDTIPLSLPQIVGSEDDSSHDIRRVALGASLSRISTGIGTQEMRGRALGVPSYARLVAGSGPDARPISEHEQMFRTLVALAHGLRGFSVEPAVQRARHVGALLDVGAAPLPAAESWATLLEALERCQLHVLRPEAAVSVVIPERLRELALAADALRPIDAEWFELQSPLGARAALADDLDPALTELQQAERFFVALTSCMRRLRVPFVVSSDLQLDSTLELTPWTIVVATPTLEPTLSEGLRYALTRGAAVSLGPFLPASLGMDAGAEGGFPLLLPAEAPALADAVGRVVNAEGLRQLQADPPEVEVIFHIAPAPADALSVLFVINPTENDLQVEVACPGYDAVDALSQEPVHSFAERLELGVPARCVRMLELRSTS